MYTGYCITGHTHTHRTYTLKAHYAHSLLLDIHTHSGTCTNTQNKQNILRIKKVKQRPSYEGTPSPSGHCISIVVPLYSSLWLAFPHAVVKSLPPVSLSPSDRTTAPARWPPRCPRLRFQNKKAFHALALGIPTFYSDLTTCPDLRG